MSSGSDPVSFSLEVDYPQPREEVFSAFASAEVLAQWIAPMEGIATRVRTFNFAVEGWFEIIFEIDNAAQRLCGQFTTIRPHSSLGFTWMWMPPALHSGVESHVRVEFAQHGDGTRLTLTHERLDAPGMTKRHRQGWLGSLKRLHQCLEKIT